MGLKESVFEVHAYNGMAIYIFIGEKHLEDSKLCHDVTCARLSDICVHNSIWYETEFEEKDFALALCFDFKKLMSAEHFSSLRYLFDIELFISPGLCLVGLFIIIDSLMIQLEDDRNVNSHWDRCFLKMGALDLRTSSYLYALHSVNGAMMRAALCCQCIYPRVVGVDQRLRL